MIELAEGAPPHSNLNPLRAIFVIPTKPAPTLADPDSWSPEMLDFVRCCCQKDHNQRHDSALLSSHPFIKQEVIALRSLHESDGSLSKLSATGKYTREAQQLARAPGLPALRRFMQRIRRDAEKIESDESHHEEGGGSVDPSVAVVSPLGESAPMGTGDFGTVAARGSGQGRTSPPQVSNQSNGYFQPTSSQYLPPKPLDLDPALVDDKLFHSEMEKLSRAFETKLAALQAAHELSQQQLIAEAKLRNSMPLDVSSLMEKAAERNTKEKESRKAMQDASSLSVLNGVSQINTQHKRLSSSPPSSVSRPGAGVLGVLPEQATTGSINGSSHSRSISFGAV